MPDPQLKFDREELSIELSGITGGWTLGQLGELSLFDSAQVQFPSMWNDYKTQVAIRILEAQWRLSARLMLEQTLEAGVEFTGADGSGQSISLDTDLKYHIMERPTVQIDLSLKVTIDGSFDGQTFDPGSPQFGAGLRIKF